MKLYTSLGPNPRILRMFAAEKGIKFDEVQEIDIITGECRQPPYLAVNPNGSCPALVLDSGLVVTEVLASCEYLEELKPEPALIGANAEERARVRTLAREIDLSFTLPLTLGFRAMEGRPMFEPRIRIVRAEAGPDLKAIAIDELDVLEKRCAGRTFIAGDKFTLPDIMVFCFVEFGKMVGIETIGERPWLKAWHARVAARPSTAA